MSQMIDLGTVTRQTFDPHLGPGFTLHADRTIPLELVSISSLPTRRGAARASFSLLLRAAERSHVPQAVYTITHAELGRMDAFIVPLGPDQVGMTYEIIFG